MNDCLGFMCDFFYKMGYDGELFHSALKIQFYCVHKIPGCVSRDKSQSGCYT